MPVLTGPLQLSLQRNLHSFRVHQRTSSLIFCRGGRVHWKVMMSVMNKTWLEAVFKCTFLNWCLLCWENLFPKHLWPVVVGLPISTQNTTWPRMQTKSFLSIIVTLQPVCKEQTSFYRNRGLTLSQRSEYGDRRHVLSLLELSYFPPYPILHPEAPQDLNGGGDWRMRT